jgi:EPS-associated MarR family transcriptional regulator
MDESHFKALKELARKGDLSQRELSDRIGLSLGRVNFLVNSLIKSGYIKARRFKNSKKKIAYMYVLTPKGVARRVEGARQFLERKTREYERLVAEIEELRAEVEEEEKAVNGQLDHGRRGPD